MWYKLILKKDILFFILFTFSINFIYAQKKSSSLEQKLFTPDGNGYVLSNITISVLAEGYPLGAGFYGYEFRAEASHFNVNGYKHEGKIYSIPELKKIVNKYNSATGNQTLPTYTPGKIKLNLAFFNGLKYNDFVLDDWGGKILYGADKMQNTELKTPMEMDKFTINFIELISAYGSNDFMYHTALSWYLKDLERIKKKKEEEIAKQNASDTKEETGSNSSSSNSPTRNTSSSNSSTSNSSNYNNSNQNRTKIKADLVKEINKNTRENIYKIEKASSEFSAVISNIIEDNISYSTFNNKIESLTSLSPSDNPKEIIREYNSKVKDLDIAYKKNLNDKLKKIERDAALQKSMAKGTKDEAMKNLGTDIGTVGATIIANSQTKKAKKEAKEKLDYEKQKLLKDIQSKLIKDYKKKLSKYKIKAAAAVNEKNENYYEEMSNYYNCKLNGVINRFSTNNTYWVDPDCYIPNQPSNKYNKPTASQIYKASLRKRNSNKANYNKYAEQFIDIAIKKSPNNDTYLFEKASYYPLGNITNLEYLGKCYKLKPSNKNYSDYYFYSYALNAKKSDYFKIYIDKYPKGIFKSEAEKKLAFYIDKETRERIYYNQIDELNSALKINEFDKSLSIHNQIQSTEFYSANHIPEIKKLKEYYKYTSARNKNSSDEYIQYIQKYPFGLWTKEAKNNLHKILEEDGDKANQKKDYNKALHYYSFYLNNFPNDERNDVIKQKITDTHASIQKKFINDGDISFSLKKYSEAESHYKMYITNYPNGPYHKEAQKKIEKCQLYDYTMDGVFWTIDHKKAIGFSYDLIANQGIGAGFGMKFNPFFIFSNHDDDYTYDDINTYIKQSKTRDIKYIFSIHFDLTKKFFPRFWLTTGIGFGYYDFYDEVEIYDRYESGSYIGYQGKGWLRDGDIAGWRPYLRLGGYYVIKSNLTIKYNIGIKHGLTHEIGISFAQPW